MKENAEYDEDDILLIKNLVVDDMSSSAKYGTFDWNSVNFLPQG